MTRNFGIIAVAVAGTWTGILFGSFITRDFVLAASIFAVSLFVVIVCAAGIIAGDEVADSIKKAVRITTVTAIGGIVGMSIGSIVGHVPAAAAAGISLGMAGGVYCAQEPQKWKAALPYIAAFLVPVSVSVLAVWLHLFPGGGR